MNIADKFPRTCGDSLSALIVMRMVERAWLLLGGGVMVTGPRDLRSSFYNPFYLDPDPA